MNISVIIDSVKKSLLHNTTSCCIILKKWKLQQVLVLFIIYCLLYRTKILSICQFVSSITRLRVLTSTYQLPNTINLSSSASTFSSQVNSVVSIRSAAGWRRSGENSSNISLKTTAVIFQWAEQLNFIQEVNSSDPAGEFFFAEYHTFFIHVFFIIQLSSLGYLVFQACIEAKSNAFHLGTQLRMLIANR